MTDTTAPIHEKKILLCRLGTYYDDKRKPYHRFLRVDGDTLGDGLSFMLNKDNKHLNGVGTVWEIDEITQPDGTLRWRLAAATYRYFWRNEADRLTWDAEQELRDAEHEAEARTQKAGADSPLRKAIQPLRDLYKTQIGANRAQLLAYIVKEIVK